MSTIELALDSDLETSKEEPKDPETWSGGEQDAQGDPCLVDAPVPSPSKVAPEEPAVATPQNLPLAEPGHIPGAAFGAGGAAVLPACLSLGLGEEVCWLNGSAGKLAPVPVPCSLPPVLADSA
ncbi:UNVERIFIED_CONTAM: hypothetical protein K2H54_024981 [Gekko kuhli]